MFLRGIIGALCLIPTLGVVILAQVPQPQPTTQTPELSQRREGFRRLNRQGPGVKRLRGFGLDELNLTDAQREQTRAVLQRHLETTRAQREELMKLREKRLSETLTAEDGTRAKALHQQLRDSMQGVRVELNSILTPEQRIQFEQFESQRKGREQEMLKRRRGFRDGLLRQ
jgi:Spy/CpxP family protein refolding chaperone